MNANEIIKKLLTRLYMFREAYPSTNNGDGLKGFDLSPLNSCFYPITEAGISLEETKPSEEWLSSALGGEAKVLWDMVNESPYTPLETELLQRLDIVHYVHHKAEAGDFVANWLAMALHAPTETVKDFEAALPYAESGLPWKDTWVWDQYKDSF